jgi:hypothetical protein
LILEGESGLGKTLFLRHLVQHGYAQDETFLRSLIYSGGIDVCLDGLNEVSPDTRAKVAMFMESNFKGNIIVGTQPLEWTPPSTAKIYLLEPLTREQIAAFLLSRKEVLPADARIRGEKYERACRDYLAHALAANQPGEVLEATQRVLSNPMDLTVVAMMLAHGEQPDLLHLREQQYRLMAEDYARVDVAQKFPLKPFSEREARAASGGRPFPRHLFPARHAPAVGCGRDHARTADRLRGGY